jgi:hypothetical protein
VPELYSDMSPIDCPKRRGEFSRLKEEIKHGLERGLNQPGELFVGALSDWKWASTPLPLAASALVAVNRSHFQRYAGTRDSGRITSSLL